MKRLLLILLVGMFLMTTNVFTISTAKDYTNFYKGITYIILDDKPNAEKYLDQFFKDFPDPQLSGAFSNLINTNSFEVTKEFNRYLDMNHRSPLALMGIALSASKLESPGAIENLERAQRLDESFSILYIGLGMEYVKQKDYPKAESYFTRAMRYSKIPEYKLFYAKLFLRKNEPAKALDLLKPEAEKQPYHFYFNFYTAKALYRLHQLDPMGKFITAAVKAWPTNPDAQLLMAKYLTGKGQFRPARDILKKLQFKDYNDDYYRIYARVLFELKDPNAKRYMDKVYSYNPWDGVINRLLGLVEEGKPTEKGNVQNRITRASICGTPIAQLQRLFPSTYRFPVYPSLPFFEMNAIKWLTPHLLAVGGIRTSGDTGKLVVINADNLNIIHSMDYKGKLKDIFPSPDGSKLIFYTHFDKDDKFYIYSIEMSGKNVRSNLLTPNGQSMPALSVGFDGTGNLAYITDDRLTKLTSESPFSLVSEGVRKRVYAPSFPFNLYMYNFKTQFTSFVRDTGNFPNIPIDCIKKYYWVSRAARSQTDIQNLIKKGENLDITASEMVRIFFSNDRHSFIIYLSDLKNAFQGIVYDHHANRTFKVNQNMFLSQFAELHLLDFDPERHELLVLTKDASRQLIRYNYKNYSFTPIADKVRQCVIDRTENRLLILRERRRMQEGMETTLLTVSLSPYIRKTIEARRDLKQILFVNEQGEVYFSTFRGETVKMDEQGTFVSCGPSFDGCRHAVSPSKTKTAAFINGRLVIVDGPVMIPAKELPKTNSRNRKGSHGH
ncbi:MAG: tetratricopeptide repeat protein [Candidatus Omnitrophota bacterium]